MPTPNAGDAAVIVVRLDMEGAKRDLARFSAEGRRAAAAFAGGGMPGGGGGGGSRGGARGGASGGMPRPGVEAAGAAPARGGLLSGLALLAASGLTPAGAVSAAGFPAASGGGLGLLGGVGKELLGLGSAGAYGRRIGGALGENLASGTAAAEARGSMRALDETVSAFQYAVGSGAMSASQAEPFFRMLQQVRQAGEVGRQKLLLSDFVSADLEELMRKPQGVTALLERIAKGVEKWGEVEGSKQKVF